MIKYRTDTYQAEMPPPYHIMLYIISPPPDIRSHYLITAGATLKPATIATTGGDHFRNPTSASTSGVYLEILDLAEDLRSIFRGNWVVYIDTAQTCSVTPLPAFSITNSWAILTLFQNCYMFSHNMIIHIFFQTVVTYMTPWIWAINMVLVCH